MLYWCGEYVGESIYIMQGLLRWGFIGDNSPRTEVNRSSTCTGSSVTIKQQDVDVIAHRLWLYTQLLNHVASRVGSQARSDEFSSAFGCAVKPLNNEHQLRLRQRSPPRRPHTQVQDPTPLSSFAGFTTGRRLFKENGIFLWDKGHMELT